MLSNVLNIILSSLKTFCLFYLSNNSLLKTADVFKTSEIFNSKLNYKNVKFHNVGDEDLMETVIFPCHQSQSLNLPNERRCQALNRRATD